MKKKLYLIGAGGLGREVESWLALLPDFYTNWEVVGYLDKNPDALNGFPSDYEIVGDAVSFDFNPNDYVLICVTNPKSKQYLIQMLSGKVNFFSYVAPNVVLGKHVSLGEGVVICPNSCISTNVVVGDFAFINCGTQVGHDCLIEKYSSLMSHVDIGGHVTLGERVYIGTGATVIPGRVIEKDVVIGTGSIVIQNLKNPGTYFGNPAKYVNY